MLPDALISDVSSLNALADFDLPRLARLRPNLIGAAFNVMKLLPARAILDDARSKGLLEPGTEVFESTSGTFGLALAMLKNHYGYSLTLISDPVIDPLLESRFQQMGVRLEIVREKVAGGYQLARLARLKELMEASPKSFFTNQYHNPANSSGYERLAHYLAERIGTIDYLVGTVGTGGSMCGTAHALKQCMPAIRIVGIDTHHSVIFGQPNGERLLRGLGNSLVPHNVDHTLFDDVHWVTAAEAYYHARRLHAGHGLYMGGTSGAAYMVADWLSQGYPDKTIVTLLPDDGYRYQQTIYNDAWLANLPGWSVSPPQIPVVITDPRTPVAGWCRMEWNQRTLSDAVQAVS